jgi:hypothetical protein
MQEKSVREVFLDHYERFLEVQKDFISAVEKRNELLKALDPLLKSRAERRRQKKEREQQLEKERLEAQTKEEVPSEEAASKETQDGVQVEKEEEAKNEEKPEETPKEQDAVKVEAMSEDVVEEKEEIGEDMKKVLSELREVEFKCRVLEKVMKKMEEDAPAEVYMSSGDRQLFDWHCANLEFANANNLRNLSLAVSVQDIRF